MAAAPVETQNNSHSRGAVSDSLLLESAGRSCDLLRHRHDGLVSLRGLIAVGISAEQSPERIQKTKNRRGEPPEGDLPRRFTW